MQSSKIKSFPINMLKKKKDMEKQKKQAEEEAAAEVYEEFVNAFETPKPGAKLFVRGNVINPGSGAEISASQSGKFYRPDKLEEIERKKEQEHRRRMEEKKRQKPLTPSISEKPPKKKGDVKKKSNLEIFKEELRMIQEEREERRRGHHHSGGKSSSHHYDQDDSNDSKSSSGNHSSSNNNNNNSSSGGGGGGRQQGSYDNGDPNTTNIYLGNINPSMTEKQLCEVFGRYGPLASIKIMWPRSDEERVRNRNCGFVAFMCRKDAERALKALNGRLVMDYEMRLGWGKSVPVPPNPVYIPPVLRELISPPAPSGLPFNAQIVDEKDKEVLKKYGNDPQRLYREDKKTFDEVLSRAVVRVVIPSHRQLVATIHRVVEFVVREGPMFEALVMNREANNPLFSFLFDNQSQPHVYYRWRLFSVLQGDHPSRWRTKEFRMFTNGPIWRPPPNNLFVQGMPEELLPKDNEFKLKGEENQADEEVADSDDRSRKGHLAESNREELEELLRSLLPQRSNIGQLMVFCIEHADAWEEIVQCITDSLCIAETPLYKKVARLYLVSDILNNCTVKVKNAHNFRKGFQEKLPDIFESVNQAYNQIEGRLKAEHFKQRVMNCFRAWSETAIYSADFLIKLQNIFLGLAGSKKRTAKSAAPVPVNDGEGNHKNNSNTNNDGDDDDDDIDGVPIDEQELDGEAMMAEPSGHTAPRSDASATQGKFKPSKWESVDPDSEPPAFSASRWATVGMAKEQSESIFPDEDDDEDIDGKPLDDDDDNDGDYFDTLAQSTSSKSQPRTSTSDAQAGLPREVLREIELKVIRYQDDLETHLRAGRLTLGPSDSIAKMVERYRGDLVRRAATSQAPTSVASLSTTTTTNTSSSSSSSAASHRSRSRSPAKSRSSHYRGKSPSQRSRSRSPKRRK